MPAPASNPHIAAASVAPDTVSLWDGLRGLSLALDLAMGRAPGHAQATAALGVRVGRRLGLTPAELDELALTALLKDAGCPTTRAAFTCEVGVDDIAFHRQVFALEEYTPRSFAALLWSLHRARPDRAGRRVVGWTRSLLGFKGYAEAFSRTAKRNGEAARVAAQLDCPAGTVIALANLAEHWDGSGSPGAIGGDRIPIVSRILAVGQLALIWGEAAGPDAVAARLGRLRPGRFDPAVLRETAAVLRAEPGTRVSGCGEPHAWLAALGDECAALATPAHAGTRLGAARPLDGALLASTFAELVDAKSPFTASHSLRVASLAGAMATLDPALGAAGIGAPAVILAGLLHDLGKLGVPNLILDKAGPPTPDEWAVLRRHPADSARVIAAVAPWAAVASWAGAHHERPDGRGYDRGLAGAAIPVVGRLLAVADAFDAMTADRPYRRGIAPEEALRRIRDGRGAQFDPQAAALLEAVVGRRGAA